MIPLAIAIAGGRGSGKTTVSTLLAARLSAKRTGFGEYLRDEARRLGLESSIESLQNLGQRLVSASPASFVAGVLRVAGWNGTGVLVVDGIRHVEMLEMLRSQLSPVPLRLVLLNVDSGVRKKRLEQRGDDTSNFEKLDAAPTEVQIFTLLPGVADLVVDATLPVAEITSTIISTFGL